MEPLPNNKPLNPFTGMPRPEQPSAAPQAQPVAQKPVPQVQQPVQNRFDPTPVPTITPVSQPTPHTNSNKKLHIILGIVSTVAVLAVGFIIFAIVSTSSGPDKDITAMLETEKQYLASYDLFATDYQNADPSLITGNASAGQAKEAARKAAQGAEGLMKSSDEIINQVSKIKDNYSGDEKKWIDLVFTCYDKRSDAMSGYKTVAENYEKLLTLYENLNSFDETHSSFSGTLGAYVLQSKAKNAKEALKSLDQMKQDLAKMKTAISNAKSGIDLPFIQKGLDWSKEYGELIDLSVTYWNTPASGQKAIETKILEKGAIAGKLINDMFTGAAKEGDEWRTTHITSVHDKAYAAELEGDNACAEASGLYSVIWPEE